MIPKKLDKEVKRYAGFLFDYFENLDEDERRFVTFVIDWAVKGSYLDGKYDGITSISSSQ